MLASDFPGKKSLEVEQRERREDQLSARIQNLPIQLTPLIGREQEVDAACTLLRRPEVRLLVLTGTGGVGKTRLSLQVATELCEDFADGICFVPLATIRDSVLVVSAISQTLKLKEVDDQPVLNLLKAYLQDKHLLLLLDNFEQVLAAAPTLSHLLVGCPHLKIIVTSRAVLHVYGEYEFPVPPLPLPDLANLPEGEALLQYAAVALFVQCAKAALPNFQATPANMHAIAEICVRLDGLPLAIELAAARSKLLPPQALLARLDRRLQVLTVGASDLPARQQTLRNMLAWSYDLLTTQEQLLFRRLSVFVGGCTLAAIEALYTALGDVPTSVLDGVASLIDKSLLYQTEYEGEEPRLMMLETIREYGLEALAEGGESEVTRQAMTVYYLQFAEEAETGSTGSQQVVWLERLEREHNNLLAALQWLLEQAENADTEDEDRRQEMALRLVGALGLFWWVHGHWSEGRNFLERALALSEGFETSSAGAKALFAAANLAFVQSDYERAATLSEGSLSLYRKLGDKRGIALSLYPLGNVAWIRGNIATARALKEEALVLFKELGYKEYVAWLLFTLALLDSSQGEYGRAFALFEESLMIHRKLGNKRGIAHTLSQLAQALFVSQGDSMRIGELLAESLALSEEVGFREGIAAYYCLSSQVMLGHGDVGAAHALAKKSVALYREMGHWHGTAESLAALAKIVAAQKDYTEARKLYEESLTISRSLGEKWVLSGSLIGLAEVVAAERQWAWAAQLWGAAETLRDAIGVPVPPIERAGYERAVASAKVHLGEKAFARAWRQGQISTLEEVLALQGREPTAPATFLTTPPTTTTVNHPPVFPDGLTAREVEVLQLLARGLTDFQIAEKLVLSHRTVHSHISSIYRKLAITSRSAATRYAIEHHIA